MFVVVCCNTNNEIRKLKNGNEIARSAGELKSIHALMDHIVVFVRTED